MSDLTKDQAQTEPRVIPQEAFDWYDEYAHGLIDRREFSLARWIGSARFYYDNTDVSANSQLCSCRASLFQ